MQSTHVSYTQQELLAMQRWKLDRPISCISSLGLVSVTHISASLVLNLMEENEKPFFPLPDYSKYSLSLQSADPGLSVFSCHSIAAAWTSEFQCTCRIILSAGKVHSKKSNEHWNLLWSRCLITPKSNPLSDHLAVLFKNWIKFHVNKVCTCSVCGVQFGSCAFSPLCRLSLHKWFCMRCATTTEGKTECQLKVDICTLWEFW